jgi:hypothetical protein
MEVSHLSGLAYASILAITAGRLLAPSSFTCMPVGFPYGLLSSDKSGEAYRLTPFRTNNRMG